METIRQQMIRDVKSVIIQLTDDVLERMTNREIYCNTHPGYREQYRKKLNDDNLWDETH